MCWDTPDRTNDWIIKVVWCPFTKVFAWAIVELHLILPRFSLRVRAGGWVTCENAWSQVGCWVDCPDYDTIQLCSEKWRAFTKVWLEAFRDREIWQTKKKKKTLDNTTQSPLSNIKKSRYVLRTLNLFNALRGAKFASINRVIGIGNTTFVK